MTTTQAAGSAESRPYQLLVAANVQAVMDRCELSVRGLARRIGVGRRTVNDWLIGAKGLPVSELAAIAGALDVHMSELVTDASNGGAA